MKAIRGTWVAAFLWIEWLSSLAFLAVYALFAMSAVLGGACVFVYALSCGVSFWVCVRVAIHEHHDRWVLLPVIAFVALSVGFNLWALNVQSSQIKTRGDGFNAWLDWRRSVIPFRIVDTIAYATIMYRALGTEACDHQ